MTEKIVIENPPYHAEGNDPEWLSWLESLLVQVRSVTFVPGTYIQTYVDGDPQDFTFSQGVWHELGEINYTDGGNHVTLRGDFGFGTSNGSCTVWTVECKIEKDGSPLVTANGSGAIFAEIGDATPHSYKLYGKVTGANCFASFYSAQLVLEER